MICQVCGDRNNERFAYCTRCGASLKSASTPADASSGAGGSYDPQQKLEQARLERAGQLVGKVLDGRYRLEAVITAGESGVVYNATRSGIEDQLAIKIFNLEGSCAASPGLADSFRRQAQNAARFKHPNVPIIYDLGVAENGLFYVATELVAGHGLGQLVAHQGALPPKAACAIVDQVCDALYAAHRQGIVHGRIGPGKIMVHGLPSGLQVKLLDLGLAIRPGSVLGAFQGLADKPSRYASPEQSFGEEADERSDIYSFGVVLYEALAGLSPSDSTGSTSRIGRQDAPPVVRLRQLNPAVPQDVEAVVMRAVERRKEARQRSAAELAQEFRDAVRAVQHTAAKTEPLPAITVGSLGDVARDTENFVAAGSGNPGTAAFEGGRSPATAAVGGTRDPIAAVEPPVFASNLSSRDWPSGVGRFLLVGGVAAVFLFLFAAALTLWWRMSVNEVGREQQFEMNSNAVSNLARNPGGVPGGPSPVLPDRDAEFDRIRTVSDSTAAPERNPALLRDIRTAEGRFPEDYRFTYLRAKLEITRSREHHEAFETLFQAGAKAIKAGESADLLGDLQRDRTSALRRLTDHKEWSVLIEALRKNDTELLKRVGH